MFSHIYSSICYYCPFVPNSFLQDLTNANPHENNGGKPGEDVLVEKRGVRSDAFVPAVPVNRQPNNDHQHSNHQSIVLEQRNPEEDQRELQPRQRVMHRTISQTDNPVIASNPSSYQFGPSDNIDERDAEDPLCATEYVQDMYYHFRGKEATTSVRPLYMENQTHINERMRSILVDWLVEVHLKFKLVPETLYLTINLIDRYLERQEVSRPRLQLVGVTALLIASKYEEIYPPELRDLVYICDRAYTRTEVCLCLATNQHSSTFQFLSCPFLNNSYSSFLFCFRLLRWKRRY